ncbi:Ti-type conjugative transfer relaxase TraA [Gluconacetobacter diazotrophicus]|uniref:Ti-type conjugative transfer relaxase TraA n=1 Tax=Gluconacetobacter diazotrophicus TaxID=33996 RepID=UPI000312E80C|nr:Ti-type conjugative transfer relaxase TraA [Gluconacetobacter diazotrophicus]
MAIYHLHAKLISRATGRSAVAAAAYRSASRLHDDRLDRAHDFTNKSGVVHSEILLPDGAPKRLADRSTLWNEVEAIEKRKDAQLSREVEFSIPREMTQEQGIGLARDFVREQFVDRGMVADLNVHWDIGEDGLAKPHAHVMLSTRTVDETGFGAKGREWNSKALLAEWRERWASLANERLVEIGLDVRIDHRSFAEQGIDLEPQNKIGPAGMRREERGEDAERAADHEEIARRNGERLIAEPSLALEALTRQQSTFTRQDLARFVDRQTADAEQFAAAMAKVEASPELVALGKDGRGRARYSTRAMVAVERRLEEASLELGGRTSHGVPLAVRRAAMTREGLGEEQALAVGEVTRSRDLSVVIGYAGTGKSTMLGVAREAWEEAGYRVRGAALSGIAAEGLEAGSGIESRTLASLERGWEKGFDLLECGDVLVVDEAGMVGSRQLERVLSAARDAGAKVVLVGDPEQLQAIEAGGAFRAVAERVGSVEITAVRRQRAGWQQEATKELATGRTEAALDRYEAAGMVHGHDTLEEARAGVVAEWDAARRAAPGERSIMLAHRRVDVQALNEAARAIRLEVGELEAGVEVTVATAQGDRQFAIEERVYFLRNDRGLGVKNGTLGTVRGLYGMDEEKVLLSVQLDGPAGPGTGQIVSVRTWEYDALDHGYAATIHKSQGVTVDRVHALGTGSMDRHGAYVVLSRHRDRVDLHWARDDVGSREGLVAKLSRERLKDTTLDYGPGRGAERDATAAYARRRGFRVPESEIGVERAAAREEPDRSAGADAAPVRGRGMFDGLVLNARPVSGRDAAAGKEKEAGREAPASPFAGLKLNPDRRERLPAVVGMTPGDDPLVKAVNRYARAWMDAGRMMEQGLPVLEHQKRTLHEAGVGLDQVRRGAVEDLASALKHEPAIRDAMREMEGLARARTLIEGIEREETIRRSPDLRAARFVREWDGLSREQRGDALKELKRDAQLESLMREKKRALGIAPGSDLDQALRRQREQSITRTISRSRGRGMDMGM